MIYTCTLNPAIDLFVETVDLKPDVVNRTLDEDYQANGKGVNVSLILKKLGVKSTALGFVAGFTGVYIKDELHTKGIDTDFVEVDGITRVNMFVHTQDQEYKIVNQGPEVDDKAVSQILEKIESLPDESMLFVSGSTPRGIDDSIYKEISKIAARKRIDLILDISSKTLLDCLEYHPYLIKPNEEELAHFYGKEDLTEEEIIYYGHDLLTKGARRVLISLGKDGAIYMEENELLRVSSPQGKVINTACAGDTMLATFVQKTTAGLSFEESLIYASAAGSSTAFSKGLSDLTDVDTLINNITVENLQGGNNNE